jgi:hypothetical protein
MEKNKKTITILAAIIIASFLLGNVVTKAAVPGDSNLLEDVWNYIFGIEEQVDELSDDVLVIETDLDLLERIHELETRITVLENCGAEDGMFPTPYADSDWQNIPKGSYIIIAHGLGSLDYVVDLQCRYDPESGDYWPGLVDPHFHNWYYGGDENYNSAGEWVKYGVWYEAYENTILVYRASDDTLSDQVRVRIWKIN